MERRGTCVGVGSLVAKTVGSVDGGRDGDEEEGGEGCESVMHCGSSVTKKENGMDWNQSLQQVFSCLCSDTFPQQMGVHPLSFAS